MDDLTVMGDDRAALLEIREALRRWLADERGLELRDPGLTPRPTSSSTPYLGYLVGRAGVEPGHRLRRALSDRTAASDLAAIASLAAAWRLI